MKVFEKLSAWQACHKVVLSVYSATSSWPADERYGLITQARRSAFSAAANIAEGSAKRGHREFRRYLDASLGSLAELCYVIKVARDLGMIAEEEAKSLEALRDEAGKLTWGLYAYVSKTP
ncbi:MAG TPA: four helix bundle protein [Gemmatimonadales bacterium]|nr:four helix bundle protein [Gemmatimonadales bacterium]